ncbi:MAG TPA: protein-glutamate O-methyltransferase CheR [Thermodesulfovibrionia bacterium]|nr:protein-glutamate O-methyltransferase CheR [Thermodesulfovibrionia bacterium]
MLKFEKEIIKLPTDVFRMIRDFISDTCGLYFDDNMHYKLEDRLNRRLKIHHMNDFREYYRFLRYSEERNDELQEIMDILTVNETYFFREQEQLAAFSKKILPELKERNKDKKKINIWSAGCSTGEEPYTIAMLIIEYGGFNGWKINILGTDISERVLKAAREGVYKKNSFRTTNLYFINAYFQKQLNEDQKISDKVKKLVTFSRLNLFDILKIKLIGEIDVIFCRNVLIYFNRDAKKNVIENFHETLVEGGYLLLGHAESLINISTAFRLQHLENDIVYQKPVKPLVDN